MLLSDMGADVVTIERPGIRLGEASALVGRGRRVVVCDLKEESARQPLLDLIARADVLVEGFRPGVMERLGLGPEALEKLNARLIYARMTGWGQDGPLSKAAGHDLNYIAITGALHAIGPASSPVPPLNLVGDYAGGSLYLISGILAALYERQQSGRGQVIDAAISDGVVSLMTAYQSMILRGDASETRASNLLDGGAPYYAVYRTADARWISIAALEPKFFAELCAKIEVREDLRAAQQDRGRWRDLVDEFTRIFASRTQSAWCELLEGTDCCFAPVLSLSEAMQHTHQRSRQAFVDIEGVRQPAPAPRFSRTPSAVRTKAPRTASDISEITAGWAAASISSASKT
jgi:alpha-methylacyl-CoA racemase